LSESHQRRAGTDARRFSQIAQIFKKMKKISLLTILFLLLSFFSVKPAFALCPGPSCTIGLGATETFSVASYDEYGIPIVGVSVNYTWTISPASLGSFVGNPNGPNIFGSSTATFKASFQEVSGTITVVANYGGGSVTRVYNINTVCIADPILYYGIAEIKDSGAGNVNWQKSTAEVLETCHPEYKLYDGIGEGS